MNISLTKELEELVNSKVASGSYHSASEVIREGLRLLKDQDALKAAKIKSLQSEIQIGLDQISRGEYFTSEESQKRLEQKIKAYKKDNQK